MHSRSQIIEQHSKVERGKSLDILKGKTDSGDHHPIHPGMQANFMVISMHVLTMDIELEILGNTIGAMI